MTGLLPGSAKAAEFNGEHEGKRRWLQPCVSTATPFFNIYELHKEQRPGKALGTNSGWNNHPASSSNFSSFDCITHLSPYLPVYIPGSE